MAATTSLLDLINAGLLQVGNKVMMRDVEGELTPQGTIISNTDRGTIEYKTPTAFSKAITNSTSGGWQQVKLKSSGSSLLDIKRKYSGYVSKRGANKGISRRRSSTSKDYTPPPVRQRQNVVHTSPVSISSHYRVDQDKLNNLNLPILVRFRDDDNKRGMLKRVSDDFTTFEVEYKGKTYPTVSAASKEMYREYAEETGEVVSINSNGFEELKYQTPTGEWSKLRELFPVEIRKRRSSQVHDDDEDTEDDDEMMSGGEGDLTPPPLTPPSPTSSSTPPPRSTMIAKHIKHSLHPASDSSAPILPIKPPVTNGKSAPIVLSLKSPPTPLTSHPHHTKRQAGMKEVELLVHVESVDSIPYEVTGAVDSYEALSNRIATVVPDFPFAQPHELGVESEYWEKHAGVRFVKAPKSWSDFPACTTLLIKKIPETFIINPYDM